MTTVLLVNNNRAAHGRFLNVKPDVGLLTSTARTFIQEGVTTQYATQVLGTTLDNGRLYAQLLTKSSRVLYDNNDALPSRSHNDITYKKWHIDDGPRGEAVQFIKNTDYITPDKAGAYLVFPTSRTPNSSPYKFVERQHQNVDAQPMEIVTASYIREDKPFQETPTFERLVQEKPITYRESKSESFSVSRNGHETRENEVAAEINASKIKAEETLPTYTVRNEFSPSGFYYEEPYVGAITERNKPSTVSDSKRGGKMLYRGGVAIQQELQSLSTVTYLGFADFTTIVGDTVIVFSPHTATKQADLGHVTTVSGAATVQSTASASVSNNKKTIYQDQISATKSETEHKKSMASALPTLNLNPVDERKSKSISHSTQFEEETTEQIKPITISDIEHEDIEAKSSVLAHEQNTSKYETTTLEEEQILTVSPESIEPSETTTPLMLSTPSDEDIAKIFASLAAAAQATEPLSSSSSQIEEQSTEIATSVLGGATTIFFEDDIIATPTLDVTSTTETTSEEPFNENTSTEYYEEPTTEGLIVSPESEVSAQQITTTEDISIQNEVVTIDQEDYITKSISQAETTEALPESKDVTEKIEHSTESIEEEECKDNKVTPTTTFKTFTYLTTFFIPVDAETTTTSIKSHQVVNTEVSYITEPCNVEATTIETPISPTSVQQIENEATVGVHETTTENYESSTEEEEITTQFEEISAKDSVLTTEKEASTTDATLPSTIPMEVVTEMKHVTESTTTEETPDAEEEIELIFKTLYTTYTYLTTFFHESTSSVSSRKEVVTNVITSTVDQAFIQQSGDMFQSTLNAAESFTAVDVNEIKPTSVRIGRPTATYDIVDSDLSYEDESSDIDVIHTATPALNEIQLLETAQAVKTYYTTYTYFTTIFVDGETEISSRTEVYTNYVTPAIDATSLRDVIEKPLSTNSELTVHAEDNDVTQQTINAYDSTITRNKIIDSSNYEYNIAGGDEQNEVTPDTATISYSTLSRNNNIDDINILQLEDGQTISTMVTDVRSSSSNGESRIIDNVDKRNILLDDQISSESNTDEILPSPTLLLQTSFTTFTYFTTMYIGSTSSNVVSRLETITNVVTETLTPTRTLSIEDSSLPVTYFTTFTYWTTLYKDGSTTITSREETISNIVTPVINIEETISPKSLQTLSIESTPTILDEPVLATDDAYEPTTFYTTYTYFTTSYIGDSTILNSRLETITNIVNHTDATGRAIAINPPSKNTIDNNNIKPDKTAAPESTASFATGLLSTILSSDINNGIVTLLSTDVYGTYIDGLYAKVLESTTQILTPTPSISSETLALSPTGVVSINEGKIVDADGISTTFYTTKALGTYIDNLYAQVIESTSSIKIDEEKKSELPFSTEASTKVHKTGLVRLIEGSIVQNQTTTVYQSKVIGTVIDGRYAQIIESTSSFLSNKIKPTVTGIEATSTKAPDQLIKATASILSPSPVAVEASLSDSYQTDSNDEEGEGEEGDEDEEGGNSRVKSRLTFSTKKRTFTPVIRSFASRNRPAFNPKRKGLGATSANTVTRSDLTPTVTATPALKGRFSSSRRTGSSGINNSASVNPSAGGSRRFSRPRNSAAVTGSAFGNGNKLRGSSARIQPTASTNFGASSRRGGFRSSARPGNEIKLTSSAGTGSSRFRVRPTLASGLLRNPSSNTYTTQTTDSTEEEFESATAATNDPTNFTDDDQDNLTSSIATTTESTTRRNQNPLLRFRRPPLSRPAGVSASTSKPAANGGKRNGNLQKNKATTTTPKPKARSGSFNRPSPALQNRARPANNLFPPRGLFRPRTPPPQEIEDEENKDQEEQELSDDDIENESDDDNDYDSSNTESKTETVPDNYSKRKSLKTTPNIKPFVSFKRRTKRDAADYSSRSNFSSRFRRPQPKAEEKVDVEENEEFVETKPKSSRYTPRPRTSGSQISTNRVRPTPASVNNGRSQFTLRDKDSSLSNRSNFKRPSTSNTSLRRKTSSTATRPKAPRLRNYSSQTDAPAYTRSNSRSRTTTSNRRPTSRPRSRVSDNSYDNNYIAPSFDGTITVTHHIPTEVTIPIVNGKVTEYKNIVTAKLSTEVLGPKQYSTVVGKDGNPVTILRSEVTGNGGNEITHFYLQETPTTSVIFTPTVIRGRKTSYSHVIPSTVYDVEPVVSTIQPQISANAPLANILLSQLLLGNFGLPQQNINPLIGNLQNQMPTTPTTEFKTRSTTYVTTVTGAMSTVIPLTFRGKEILTTIVDSSVDVITATEFITDTIIVTPTQGVNGGNQLNSLLLPLLLQQQNQPQNPVLGQIDNKNFDAQLLFQEDTFDESRSRGNFRHRNIENESLNDEIPFEENTSRPKTHRKKPQPRPQKEPEVAPAPPEPETSVITLYVSGRRPGEFSTVLSTVTVGEGSTLRKRAAEYVEVQASKLPSFAPSDNEFYDYYLMPATNEINQEFEINKDETQSLESIIGDVSKYIDLQTPALGSYSTKYLQSTKKLNRKPVAVTDGISSSNNDKNHFLA